MERRKFITQSALAIPISFGLQSIGKNVLFVNSIEGNVVEGLPASLAISSKARGEKFDHFWSKCVSAGRANEGLRTNWMEHLALVHKECGFRYLRFHGLFHDDMFVYHEEDGLPVYNWQYIDELFDRMLDIGVRPFVELSFFPGAMSPDKGNMWWGAHCTPPSDFAKWKALVENFVKHCQARYGAEETYKWYFEVWNEPDLKGFWNGTKQQYFGFYKTTVLAIKNIDPKLKVGGPATSCFHPSEEVYAQLYAKKDIRTEDLLSIECRAPWMKEFLAFCEKDNLPVDFISSHPYPTSYPHDSEGNGMELSRPVSSVHTDMQWLRNVIVQSKYTNAEIHLTEWSSSPSPRDHTHDYLQAATYIVKVNLDCIGLANSLSYWTFTDVVEETGAGNSIFHGGWGLINFQGIIKPSFHAYRMLNSLGDEILQQTEGCTLSRNSANGKVTALLYNYPAEVATSAPISKNSRDIAEKTLSTGKPRKFTVDITDLPVNASFEMEILDVDHGFALRDWQKMGSPEPPTREQAQYLRDKAMDTKKVSLQADSKGTLHWEAMLSPWSVVLIKEK